MFAIASHKFDAPRQPVDRNGGDDQRKDTERGNLVIGRFAPAPICDQEDAYYWTDEGYQYLHGSQDGVDHCIPLIVLPESRRIDVKLWEAIALDSALKAVVVAFITLAVIMYAGSIGLKRTESAAVLSERV